MKDKLKKAIRLVLMAVMTLLVYRETGPWTAAVILMLSISIECNWNLIKKLKTYDEWVGVQKK